MNTLDPRASQGLAVLAAGVVVVGTWSWGYQPAVRATHRDQAEVARLAERLADVEAMVLAAGGADRWQSHMTQRLTTLKERFPSQAQLPQLLNTLVETLKTQDLKLVNISQGNVEPVLEAEEPVLFEGTPCVRLPVMITAEGRFPAFLQALERVTAEAFPSVVSIGAVELRLTEAVGATLDATLTLYLYVVGTPAVTPDA